MFCRGDKIRSQKNSRATLQLSNSSLVSVDQNTSLNFSVPKVDATASWLIDLIKGSTFFRSRESQHLNIDTPFINAVHEGTEFLVTVDSEQTEITVFDGQVAATNQQGKINIKKGFMGIAKKGQAPRVQALTIHPEDAVQWTLYYPPLIDYQHYKSIIFQSVINTYDQGDTYQAIDKLENFPVDQQNADYLILKSSLLLTVGRVDEALLLIKQARSLNQDESTAISLESVIAVTKNRQDEALSLAQQAVTLNPQSIVAQIALSYAYQSNFKIKPALQATQEAIRLSPDNALAWARLSELQLSTGDRSEALESAKKAQALNPQLDRTQTILGFAHLAEVDIDEAKSAFMQAINLNSADPLARLGLGLSKIRKGDVEEGTLDIETAVSLDPENAIMRSYLGKAYYELKNDGYAGTELSIAKEMDLNDPTPWFYDAIRKQTTNRPVEALHDMQKAIELNDNRAVYRSSLLLDEDLAAKSASLGRIYNDLGFQQRGLLESWKSLTIDPKNYSGHRFLADSYVNQSMHQIARVSELLQSQLLQPLNLTPIQPQLSESNLLLLSGLGSTSLSFNEFNPLFTRDRFTFQASGIMGGNNTWGEDVVHSGLWNKLSYSLGQFHYETDGYRENNDLKQDIYNIFIQVQPSEKLNVQVEYRYRDLEYGDLSQNWNLDVFNNKARKFLETETMRFGLRYSFLPSSDFLFSLIHLDEKETSNESFGVNKFVNRGYLVEGQNLFQSKFFSTILGGSYYSLQERIDVPPIPFLAALSGTNKTWHSTGYFYTNIHFPNSVHWTLGISIDAVKNEFLSDNDNRVVYQANPKVGVVWNITPQTTFRIAAFRTMRRSLLTDQTIEPTQVAGFNQLYDDWEGTDSIRYGVGIDHSFSPSLFTGLEASERDLRVPMGGWDTKNTWKEQLLNAYINWAPTSKWSLNLNYKFEKFNDFEASVSPNTKTHQVPLKLNYFHPNGFFMAIGSRYVNQQLNQKNKDSQSSFTLFDFSIGYRLPKRYGIIKFEVNNVFSKKLNYQGLNKRTLNESEISNFQPERVILSKFLFNF